MPSRHASSPARRIGRTARNLLTLLEAAVLLAIASAAIRWLPFRRVMAAADLRRRSTRSDPAAARRVRWAMDRAADAAPWRAVCFQRGLAAHWMLRRRGIASFLHYGINGNAPTGISAHVWVVVDGVPLLGGPEAARHQCMMIRPDPAR